MNRYIYHYCASTEGGKHRIDGILRLVNKPTDMERYREVKELIMKGLGLAATQLTIHNLSYLGREDDE